MTGTQAFLAALGSLLVLFPACISCLLTARCYLRYSFGRSLLWMTCILLPVVLAEAWLRSLSIPLWILGIVACVVLLAVFRMLTLIDWARLLAVYVGILAIETFPLQFALAFDATLHPDSGAAQMSMEAGFVQLGLALLLLAAFAYPAWHDFADLLDELDLPRLWYLTVLMSAAVLAGNLACIPLSYRTLAAGRVAVLFPILEAIAMAMLIGVYLLFYRGARIILERADLQKRSAILEREAQQYDVIRAYVSETGRLRHDFRHSVHVLRSLAQKGDLGSLTAHLDEYARQLPEAPPMNFCQNTALNSLFEYYASLAQANNIRIQWDLSLPDPLPFSELDLTSLFGNLMDNAIAGCQTVPPVERYFLLTAQTIGPSIYIVSTNSFDGQVRKGRHGYLSTRHRGPGTGIQSILTVTERYSGHADLSNTSNEFHANIMLPLPI